MPVRAIYCIICGVPPLNSMHRYWTFVLLFMQKETFSHRFLDLLTELEGGKKFCRAKMLRYVS